GDRFAFAQIQRTQELLVGQHVDPCALLLESSKAPPLCWPREGAAQSYRERLEIGTDSSSDWEMRSPVEATLVDWGFEWKAVASCDGRAWFVRRRHGYASGGDRVERFCTQLDSSKS